MPDDASDAYDAAKKRLDEAAREVGALVDYIAAASAALTHWKKVMLDGRGVGVGYPQNVVLRDGPRIDTAKWPTAAQLDAALVKWHKANAEAWTAHGKLPVGQTTTPPPPGVPPT